MTDPPPIRPPSGIPATLQGATEDAITLGLLRGDPLYRYIVPGSARTMVQAALAEGRSRASWMKAIYGAQPVQIAKRLNVPIRLSDSDAGWGTAVVFAQYETRSGTITVYRPAIAKIERLLRELGMDSWLPMDNLSAVFIAHELYHYLECSALAVPLSRRYRVNLLRVGPWCWRGGLVSLDEIGAGAFAQALLDLPNHPRVLDMLCIYDADPETFSRIAAELDVDGATRPSLLGEDLKK